MLDNYSRIVKIEALTMIDMARKNIFPAINNYVKDVLGTATLKANAGINATVDLKLANTLSSLSDEVFNFTEKLENLVIKSNSISDSKALAFFIKDEILPCMELLRASADKAETLTDDKYWPYPSYAKLLFSVK